MASSSLKWQRTALASALLVLGTCTALTASARPDEQEEEENEREESWQIEQRQRWFEETRSLRNVPNAGKLRAAASKELVDQQRALAPFRRGSGETWAELGPSSMDMVDWTMGRVAGRLNVVAPHPTDDSTLYIGSAAGGVWKTTNNGISWTPIFDSVGTQPIGSIFIEPANPNRIWVGTGDKNGGGCAGYFGQGVFLSEDGGATWTARNGTEPTAMPLSIVNSVVVSPTDSNVILAGGAGSCSAAGALSGAGVFRSTDRGLTWTRVLSNNVEDMIFVPGTSTVYAGLNGTGVSKSTDGGATWTSVSNGLALTGSRLRLAMAGSDSNVLYALAGSRLFRTGDGGANWTQVNASACEGQCSYNQTLAVHPTQPDTILVGTIRPARSTNGGTTLTRLTDTWGNTQEVHQDTHVVLFSRNDPNRFWIGSDGGIWRTDNNGVSWANMNANVNITQFYDIAVHPVDPNIVFGGAQDNSSSGRRTSLLWELTFASGDGFMNAIDPTNPSIVFQTSYPQGQLPNIVRSNDGGSPGSYSGMPTTGLTPGAFPWVTPLAIAGNKIFIASDRLYRADTTGTSWTAVSPAMGSAAAVVTPQLNGMLMPTFVGTSGGKIYASPDAGVASPTFTDVTGDYPGGRVSDVAIDPVNAQRVFITRAGFGASRLYRSTQGGTTWVAVGAGLPNVPANSVAIDPINTNRIFVATDVGVYESTDGGDNFVAFAEGMPAGVVVQDLEIDDSPHTLTAGTYARGAWRVVLAGGNAALPPTANFSFANTGLDSTFTNSSIDSDGTITGYSWNFGDGSAVSTQTNPTHTFPAPGRYTVTLTATDNNGQTGSYARVLRFPAPPIPLVNGVTLSNQHGLQGDDLYYTLDVPNGAANLVISTTGMANEDADLYVKLGNETLCTSAGATADETCTIAAPASGQYTIIVNAYSDLTSFTITASYTVPDRLFANGFD
ncbi:PKD domain-containing protein [Tahibacter amnicola]|uniref:PKD domain-containing protein n=1 Tax=Tahibacter amnicola TaxID=2976241 RepID=A0ABY6BEP4_9GAMM|nr:PKD domain-containing protein [Tahibacter amnicola]UXI68056.1 PKD domain-containing protein [Tahibacter amnicola]